MFLGHARTTRLAATYLLFTVALVIVPKADIPETLFDEANTPTDEMVVQKDASLAEYRQSVTAFAPRIFAHSLRIKVRRILPAYAGQMTECRTLLELFCSLRC
jgi:hypothetical protein